MRSSHTPIRVICNSVYMIITLISFRLELCITCICHVAVTFVITTIVIVVVN